MREREKKKCGKHASKIKFEIVQIFIGLKKKKVSTDERIYILKTSFNNSHVFMHFFIIFHIS